jgi:predicted Zn-ribbon and HTH transcriptional regulator
MPIEVVCSNCNSVIYAMVILKPIREVIKDSRCPICKARILNEYKVEVSRF